MDLCKCCPSAHQDIPLLGDLCSTGSIDELLTEDIIAGLGETSLNWFDELTESYLAGQRKVGGDTPGVDLVGWSPCPRGGLFTFQGGSRKPDPVTPITALLSLSDSCMGLPVDSSSPARSRRLEFLCADQPDIRWTSAMATPVRSGRTSLSPGTPGESDITVSASFCVQKPKMFHRKLFSPVAASACDDSLTQILEGCGDVDVTVESERTLVNEDDLESTLVSSVVTPPGFCGGGNGAYNHSTPVPGVGDTVAREGSSRLIEDCTFQQVRTEGPACTGNGTDVDDEYFGESFCLSAADLEVTEDPCVRDGENVSHHLSATTGKDMSGCVDMPECKQTEDSLLPRKNSKKSGRLASKSHIELVLSEIFPSQCSPRSFEGGGLNLDMSVKHDIGAVNGDYCASAGQEGEILEEDLRSVRAQLNLGTSPMILKEVEVGTNIEQKTTVSTWDQLSQAEGAVNVGLDLGRQPADTLTVKDSTEEQAIHINGWKQKAHYLDMFGTNNSRGLNETASVQQSETSCNSSVFRKSDFVEEDTAHRQELDKTEMRDNRISRKRRRIDLQDSRKIGPPSGEAVGVELCSKISSQQSIAIECVPHIQKNFHESSLNVDSLKNSVKTPVILRSILKDSGKQKSAVRKRVRFNFALNSSQKFVRTIAECLKYAIEDSHAQIMDTDGATSHTESSPGMLDFCERECLELPSFGEISDIAARNDTCSTLSEMSLNCDDSTCLVDLSLIVPGQDCCSETDDQNDSQNNSLTSSQIEEDASRDEYIESAYTECSPPDDCNTQATLQEIHSLTSSDIHKADLVAADENLDEFGFEDSFQISPTFCSQIVRCSQTVCEQLPQPAQIVRCSQTVDEQLPPLAAPGVSDISRQDESGARRCHIANGLLGVGSTDSHDLSSGNDDLFNVHNRDLSSVNDVLSGISVHTGNNANSGGNVHIGRDVHNGRNVQNVEGLGVDVCKVGEKVSDSKVEVEHHSGGDDFSLDDGDDEVICAAALQAERADDILQLSRMLCKHGELSVSAVKEVSENSRGELGVSSAVKEVSENSHSELGVSSAVKEVIENSRGELSVSAVKEVSKNAHGEQGASRSTTAESLASSSSSAVGEGLTAFPLTGSCIVHGTLAPAASLLTLPPPPASLLVPPPSARTAASPAVAAPTASITPSVPLTVTLPGASTSIGSSLTLPSTLISTTPSVFTTTGSGSTTGSVLTTSPASTALSASSSLASAKITTKPPIDNSGFDSDQPFLHMFRRKQRKFLYPNVPQTSLETLIIAEETTGSVAGGTSLSAQTPVGDTVRRGTRMTPSRGMLEGSTCPASRFSGQGVKSDGAAGEAPGQSVGDVVSDIGPPRKKGQLLGFAKFSETFQMSNGKASSNNSVTGDTFLTPVEPTETVADNDNQSKAGEDPCESSSKMTCDVNTVRRATRQLIRDIPSQWVDNQEILSPGSVSSPADGRHHQQVVVQASATCMLTSELHSASGTSPLDQNSTASAVSEKSAAFSARSNSCTKDDEDIDITSHMWSQTEFSQMQTWGSDNETNGWDSEDSVLEHVQCLEDQLLVNGSSQTEIIHRQNKSLCVASSVPQAEQDQTEQFSHGEISSGHPSEPQAALNHSDLSGILPGEDNLEDHLDNMFRGLKHQSKSPKPFVVPFLHKKSCDKSSGNLHRELAGKSCHKGIKFDEYLTQVGPDVCRGNDAYTDFRDNSKSSAVQMNNVPGVHPEHLDTPKENVLVGSAFDINSFSSETTVIKPKSGLSCGTQGFSTASGKTICISENAKSQAWKLMQESIASSELVDFKDVISGGCVDPAGAGISSLCLTSVLDSSSRCEFERITDVARTDRYIASGPIVTMEKAQVSGSSKMDIVNISVASSTLCVTSASLPLTSSAALTLISTDLSSTYNSKHMPGGTDVIRRNLLPKLSIDPKLPSVSPVAAVVASPGVDEVTGNQGMTRLDKSYKGFRPFKPPKLLHGSKKMPSQGNLKLKDGLKEGLSCINVEKSKDGFKTIQDVAQKPKENDSSAVDNKFVDDWEDDSSFQDLILMDGATTRGAIDGDSPGSHIEVHRAIVEVSDRSADFLKSPQLDSAGDPNTDLGATAKGCGTEFPEGGNQTNSTLPQQQSLDGHTDILVNTLEYGQKRLDEDKPQITARHNNFNEASCSTGHQMELLESPNQTEDTQFVDSVESSWLTVSKSRKGVDNCVESYNSCSGMSAAVQSDVSATGLLQVSVAENASKKAGNFLEEFGAADDVKEVASKFSAATSGCVMPVPETAGSVGDVKDPILMSTFSVGFTTAGGSKVSVSDKALQHARSFLGDTSNVEDVKGVMPSVSSGFTTAGGSKVSVSDKALHHARSFLGEAGNVEDVKDVVPAYSGGFKTAGDAKVSVSDKALQHARRSSFVDAEDTEDVKNVMSAFYVGFTAASGSEMSVSEKPLQHARSFLDNVVDVKDVVPAFSGGFTTAGGAKVSVSDKGLHHARSFLGEAGNVVDVKDVMPVFSGGFTTAGGAKVSVSDKALQNAKSFLADSEQTFDSSVQKRDKQSRTASSGLLQNSGELLQCHETFTGQTHASELRPASFGTNPRTDVSGKPTPNVQKKYGNMLQQCAQGNAGNSPQTVHSGFSTASGSRIHVSEEAVRGAKDILDRAEDSAGSFKAGASNTFEVPSKSLQNTDCCMKPVVSSEISPANSLSCKDLIKKRPMSAAGPSVSEQTMREIHCLSEGENGRSTESSSTSTKRVDVSARNLCHASPACVTRSSPSVGVKSDHESSHLNHLSSQQTKENIAPGAGSAPCMSTEPKATSDSRWPQKKELQTPVRASCEGFHFDRRKTKGRSLSAVLSMPLNSSTTVSPAVLGNKFQPPYKKAKMCDDGSSYSSMTTSGSGTITRSDSHSGTSASSFMSSSATPSNFDMGMGRKNTSEEPTAALGTPNEQLLCPSNHPGRRLHSFREDSNWSEAFQGAATDLPNPSASTSSLKEVPGAVLGSQCSSTGHQPKLNSDRTSHRDPSQITLDVMLEESRMKQDAIIRKKQKGTIRPVCGRWLEFRKRKEALKTLKSLGLVPETGLAREELLKQGLSHSCLQVNSRSAGSFRFDLRRFYPCLDACILVGDGALLVPDKHGFCGAQEFYRALLTLDGVDPKLVDETWVQNHYRWIVWKLAAYEVCFPGIFAGRSLTPEMVMLQLKYRYDREIDLCHRSAIKKIVERDDTACKRLILCVASVKQILNGQFSVELTDGWYSIPAQLDDCLTQLVARKRIRPGDKIVSSGAELIGCADGCSPLELKEGTALKLNGNSTRPAPWYSRLGYCFPPSALCVPLSSLSHSGGLASCVDVVVCRKYPVMYMEKLPDGSSVFRTAEEEDKARQRHEDWFQMEGEKVYMSLQKELEDDTRACRPGRGRKCPTNIKSLWSGQDLAAALEDAMNPEELQQSLSSSQMERLMTYRQAEVDRRQQEINRKLQEVMAEACKPRHVTSVIKFKVRGCCRSDVDSRSSCHLVVWRPGSEWLEVEEGKRYQLFSISVAPGRGRSEHGKVALTANRQTRIQARPISDNLLDIVYSQREAWPVRELLSGQPFEDEFDFVGVVIQVVAPAKSTGPTCVFAADKNSEILCIRFWTSLITSLQPGQCFVASSLILTRGLQNSGSRPSLVSADARSDVTSVTTSARCARSYSDLFAQVSSISKTKGFLSDLQRKLQVHGYSTDRGHNAHGHLMSRHQDYDEDFPPEIVDKIFAPMSQETLVTGRQATLVDLWKQQPPVNQQSLATPGSSLQPGFGSGKSYQSSDCGAMCSSVVDTTSTSVTNSDLDTNQTICDGQSALKKGRDLSSEGDIQWEKNPLLKRKHEDEELDHSVNMDVMSKRKSILRTKMSKLLAYERPSKLTPLPCGNSPASGREFKSPIAKKL